MLVMRTVVMMLAASVVAAGMALLVMVVGADRVGIVAESAGQKGRHIFICAAGSAGVKLNPGLGQRRTCAAADAAADENIDSMLLKETGQRAVAAAIGVNDLGGEDLGALYLIDLKLLAMPEVLKNLSVFIGDRDVHANASYFLADIRIIHRFLT